jgi:hypothetical protein
MRTNLQNKICDIGEHLSEWSYTRKDGRSLGHVRDKRSESHTQDKGSLGQAYTAVTGKSSPSRKKRMKEPTRSATQTVQPRKLQSRKSRNAL